MVKNRIELAKYFAELGFKNGAEIGTCYGRYSEMLCQNIPELKLIAIDNWNNPANSKREQILGISCEETARKKLAPYPAKIIKKDSIKAAKEIPDGSLDFVFIDADHHYEKVKDDLNAWTPKVRKGGIVAGHDYYVFRSGNRGVIDAVDEFVGKKGYKLNVIPKDRSAIDQDDRVPCWYFFK